MPPTANLNFPLNLERSPAVTTDAAVGCDMEEQGDKADVEGGGYVLGGILSLSLSLSLSHTRSLSLSLSHTHTNMKTKTRKYTQI